MSTGTRVTLRSSHAKRRRGMQTFRGEIRVDACFYQAFVTPEFVLPETEDGDPCPPDWDEEDPEEQSAAVRLTRDKVFRAFSPRLFDDTASSVASFQDILLVSKSVSPTSSIAIDAPESVAEAMSPVSASSSSPSSSSISHTSSTPTPSDTASRSSTVSPVDPESVPVEPSSAIESSSDRGNCTDPSELGPPGVSCNSDCLRNDLCHFLAAQRGLYMDPLGEDTDVLSLSASHTLAMLRRVFKEFETIFCSIDGLALFEKLYVNVTSDILRLVASARDTTETIRAEDCWKHRTLVHHLVRKHLPRILADHATDISEEQELFIDPERSLWRQVRIASKQRECTQNGSTSSQPTFASLCTSYEQLQSQLKTLAFWKQAFEDVYRLRDGQRLSVEIAQGILIEGEKLLHICDLNDDIARLRTDVEQCLAFRQKILKEFPSFFSFDKTTPVDVDALKPFVSTYSRLPFMVSEGEELMSRLKEAVSWQAMAAAAMNGKDLDRCKDLVEAYDGTAFSGIDICCFRSLREDVLAAQWLQRLERILAGKKPFSLTQLTELLSPSHGLAMSRRFWDHSATQELFKHCRLIEAWLRKSLRPPFVCLCHPADKADLAVALALVSSTQGAPVSAVEAEDIVETEDAAQADSAASDLRLNETELDSFCAAYQATRVLIPAFRVFDQFRQRLQKWKKRQRRAVSSHGAVTFNEAELTLKEGLSLKSQVDIDDLVAELEETTQRHEAWVLQVDELMAHVRYVVGEGEIARASSNGLLSLSTTREVESDGTSGDDGSPFPSRLVLKDALKILSAAPDCPRPSLDDLSRLVAQHAESPIVDPERSRLLRQLQDHAEKWRRRARDCVKISRGGYYQPVDRLKLQLLLEAKYFSVDLDAEKRLAGPFYLHLWRERVAALCPPLNEEEVLELVTLPKEKGFVKLLHTQKSFDDLTAKAEPLVSDDTELSTAPSSEGLECSSNRKLYGGVLQRIFRDVPEVDVLSEFLKIRETWIEKCRMLSEREPRPTIEEWKSFLEVMDSEQPIHLNSVHDVVSRYVKEALYWSSRIQTILTEATAIHVDVLRDIDCALKSCPVYVETWSGGKALLEFAERLEREASRLLEEQWSPRLVEQAETFLKSIPHPCKMSGFTLDTTSLTFVSRLSASLQQCLAWMQKTERLRSSSLSTPLDEWEEHIQLGLSTRLTAPIMGSVEKETRVSREWQKIVTELVGCTGKLDLDLAELLVAKPYGLGCRETLYYEISSEVDVIRKKFIPDAETLLETSASQREQGTFNSQEDLFDLLVLTRQLRQVLDRIQGLRHVQLTHLCCRIETEIQVRVLNFKMAYALTCGIPHPGCPKRNISGGPLEPCCFIIPYSAAVALKEDIACYSEDSRPFLALEPLFPQYTILKDLNVVELDPLIETLRQLPRHRPAALDIARPAVDSSLYQTFVSRLQTTAFLMRKIDKVLSSATLTVPPSMAELWTWPDITSDCFWDMWVLTAATRTSWKKDICACPLSYYASTWKFRWRSWIFGTSDQQDDSSIDEQQKAKVAKNGSVRKVVSATLTTELCVGMLGLKMSSVLRDFLVSRIVATLKCPKNSRFKLGPLDTFSCEEENLLVPAIYGQLDIPRHTEEWARLADILGRTSVRKLEDEKRISLCEVLSLLRDNREETTFGLKPTLELLYQAVVLELVWLMTLPQLENIESCFPIQLVLVRRGVQADEELDPAFAFRSTSTQALTPEVLLQLLEHCELLPFQTPLKGFFVEKLQDAVQWALMSREVFLFLTPMTLVTRFFGVNAEKRLQLTGRRASTEGVYTISRLNAALRLCLWKDDVKAESFQVLLPQTAQQLVSQDNVASTSTSTSWKRSLVCSVEALKFLQADVGLCSICASYDADAILATPWLRCDECGRWYHLQCIGLPQELSEKLDTEELTIYKFCCSVCLLRHSDVSDIDSAILLNSPWYSYWLSGVHQSVGEARDALSCRHLPPFESVVELITHEPSVKICHEGHPLEQRVATVLSWLLDVSLTILDAKDVLPIPSTERSSSESGVGSESCPSVLTKEPKQCNVKLEQPLEQHHGDDLAALVPGNDEDEERETVTRRTTRSNTGVLRARSAKALLGGRRKASSRLLNTPAATEKLPKGRRRSKKTVMRRDGATGGGTEGLSGVSATASSVSIASVNSVRPGLFTLLEDERSPRAPGVDIVLSCKAVLDLLTSHRNVTDGVCTDEELDCFCKEYLQNCVTVNSPQPWNREDWYRISSLSCTMPTGRTVVLHPSPPRQGTGLCSERTSMISLARLVLRGCFTGVLNLPLMPTLATRLQSLAEWNSAFSKLESTLLAESVVPSDASDASNTFSLLRNAFFRSDIYSIHLPLSTSAEETLRRCLQELRLKLVGSNVFSSPAELSFRAQFEERVAQVKEWLGHLGVTYDGWDVAAKPSAQPVTALRSLYAAVKPFLASSTLVDMSETYLTLREWEEDVQQVLTEPESVPHGSTSAARHCLDRITKLLRQGRDLTERWKALQDTDGVGVSKRPAPPWDACTSHRLKKRHKLDSSSSRKECHTISDEGTLREATTDCPVATASPSNGTSTVGGGGHDELWDTETRFNALCEKLSLLLERGETLQRHVCAVLAAQQLGQPVDLGKLSAEHLNALKEMRPPPIPPAVYSFAALEHLVQRLEQERFDLPQGNALKEVYVSLKQICDKLVAAMNLSLDGKTLPWEVYTSLSSLYPTAGICWFGTASEWYLSTHQTVMQWIEAVRGLTRDNAADHRPSECLTQALSLKKACNTTLRVDVSRTRLYSELRHLIRELRRRLAVDRPIVELPPQLLHPVSTSGVLRQTTSARSRTSSIEAGVDAAPSGHHHPSWIPQHDSGSAGADRFAQRSCSELATSPSFSTMTYINQHSSNDFVPTSTLPSHCPPNAPSEVLCTPGSEVQLHPAGYSFPLFTLPSPVQFSQGISSATPLFRSLPKETLFHPSPSTHNATPRSPT